MTWKSLPLILILFLIFVNSGYGSDSATPGTAIVAVRTSSLGGLGHVGVAFQNANGTWTAGAIEGAANKTMSNLGGAVASEGEGGGWMNRYNTLGEVEQEFSNRGYDKIKIISVENSNAESANNEIKSFPKAGYVILKDDCLTKTDAVLNAYGVKNPVFAVRTTLWNTIFGSVERLGGLLTSYTIPVEYFESFQGKEESLPKPRADLQTSTQETAKSLDVSNTKESSTAQANDLSIGNVHETAKSKDESNAKESSVTPTLYPITSPPPDESNAKESSVTPTLYPITSPPPDESNGAVNTSFGTPSSSSDVQSQEFGSSSESNLGGVNFTSIKLNSIAVSADQEGGINFDLILKAQKAEGAGPGIDLINSTQIGATAFMTGLANPDCKFWVSLNPWEEDRIIDEQLRKSDVGRIMLEADLQMKRDIHYYDNPCATETGVAFWNLLDEKRDALVEQCMKKFPGDIEDIDNVQFFPVERHWIVPDKIYSYTNGTQIYVINATLTINSTSEEDRSSFQVYNQNKGALSEGCREELNKSAIEFSRYVNMLQDRMILPYVIADVNHDEKYEDLRDVYVALALAQWYKSKITPHMDIFRGSLDLSNPPVLRSQEKWSPQEIWDKYVYSFKNGEYKCWKNETTKTATGTHTESSPRSAGGVKFASVKDHMVNIEVMPPEVQDHVKKAVSNGFVNEGGDILFGNRIHVSQKDENLISGTSSGSSLASLNSKNGAKSPSNENGTDNATVITNEKAGYQNKEIPSVAKDTGNAAQVTCPKGWSGPDKNGECWQLEIKDKS